MAKPYGTDPAGNPVNLIGAPLVEGRGAVPTVVVEGKEGVPMVKAERDGVYRLGKAQFKIRKGDNMPEGAELIEKRAKQAAPENKSRKAAPESKSKD